MNTAMNFRVPKKGGGFSELAKQVVPTLKGLCTMKLLSVFIHVKTDFTVSSLPSLTYNELIKLLPY
jgi:hypothetical protein